uniref:Uncharacterized protein n=1 Tax=Arundo donax TaxID=35708 RepID=A0A0A9AP68_ARUDO
MLNKKLNFKRKDLLYNQLSGL